LFSRDVGFESQRGHWLSWLNVFTGFLSPSRQELREYLRLSYHSTLFWVTCSDVKWNKCRTRSKATFTGFRWT
jgi:hypothetical protein